jgi:hypothetical protein
VRHSAIYRGEIRHRRFAPVENSFRYGLFMMYLDLSELAGLFRGVRFWSAERPNLAYLKREDHLGDPSVPLETAVRDLVEERLGSRPAGPVRMLAHLRYFGHCFNPVSFFYCYSPCGEKLETIVAEVRNTPWMERHYYVMGEGTSEARGKGWRRHRFRKAFHVSPFLPMELDYDWRFKEPGETIHVHMIGLAEGRRLLDATLSLRREPLTAASLQRVLLHYPFMTVKVVAAIHWQALRLAAKRAPFFVHPSKRPAKTGG